MKLDTQLRELKQHVYGNCQDLEYIQREAQNRFVAPSLRHYTAPRLSPPPVLSTSTSTSMTTKNLGYDNTEDMLANVRGHAACGLETLHRHTARAVQHFPDSSWLSSMRQLSSRSCHILWSLPEAQDSPPKVGGCSIPVRFWFLCVCAV